MRRSARPTRASITSASSRAARLPEHRSLGLLFRHPQGHALLRSAVEPQAPRRARSDRADLPRRHALARADPRLHQRGSLAVALSADASRCISKTFRDPAAWRDDALAAKWETSGASARGHRRAGNRTGQKRSAPRWKPRRSSISRIADLRGVLDGVDFAEICITSELQSKRRRACRRLPPRPKFRRRRGAARARGANARALGNLAVRRRGRRISRRDAARRAGAARIERRGRSGRQRRGALAPPRKFSCRRGSWALSPPSPTLVFDQVNKIWLIFVLWHRGAPAGSG